MSPFEGAPTTDYIAALLEALKDRPVQEILVRGRPIHIGDFWEYQNNTLYQIDFIDTIHKEVHFTHVKGKAAPQGSRIYVEVLNESSTWRPVRTCSLCETNPVDNTDYLCHGCRYGV